MWPVVTTSLKKPESGAGPAAAPVPDFSRRSSPGSETPHCNSSPDEGPGSPDLLLPELPSLLEDLGGLINDMPDVMCMELGMDQDSIFGGSLWGDPQSQQQHAAEPTCPQQSLDKLQRMLRQVQHQDVKAETAVQGDVSAAVWPDNETQHTLAQLEHLISQQRQLLMREEAPSEAAAGQLPPRAGGVNAPSRPQPQPCKRTAARNQRLGDLTRELEKKQAQADHLEHQNGILRRRQRMLDAFIRVSVLP